MMTSKEIRKTFLEFFKSKNHLIVPSAPIVVKNDPTLMFTNAGMNQFKDFFLGNQTPTAPRIADTQKCLRVSGKHNDLEEVGIDTYHHTMFEMLGNWSFGDYFKKEAIEWAWELLTEVYKIPKEQLYVTIFEGDAKEKLEKDNESYTIWSNLIDESRIINGNKKDNFWEMGETGPCGPCSEIHVDIRPEEERKKGDGKNFVNASHPEVIEIWNNVFIQFNRKADGSLEQLPAKHVDTGMGFERLVRVLQQKRSNYDSDVFTPLINFIEQKSKIKYGASEKSDIAMRVMSDHIRAIIFAIADGQLPSNTGAGYVIRRILRRAVRYSYSYLNIESPIMNELVPVLAEQFDGVFPELKAQQDFIQKVILEEETSFLKTLDAGLKRISTLEEKVANGFTLDGKTAFELYDTYGFPLDLTKLIVAEKNWKLDEDGFNSEMAQQKNRSRKDAASETGDWIILNDADRTEFIGYDFLEAETVVLKYREQKVKDKKVFQLVLGKTPFYAESGGQVGDKGMLDFSGEKISVLDTKKENDLNILYVNKLPVKIDGSVTAKVDATLRGATILNHSATHLLHAALRKVLGTHVQQKGSLVAPDYLRFDFSHFAKMTEEELEKVQSIVNEKIREDIHLDEKRNVPIKQATETGAMALFGEKYGDFVRMITFDKNYSVELCGGNHASSTGKIGFFIITAETAVAAGVRRIEAITGAAAERFIRAQVQTVDAIKTQLNNPKDVVTSISLLKDENEKLKKEIERYINLQVSVVKDSLVKNAELFNGMNVVSGEVSVPSMDALKKLCYDVKNEIKNLFMVVGTEAEGKAMIAVMIAEELVKTKNLNAGKIIKEISADINGGGGGQPHFATAGGTNIEGLTFAIQKAREKVLSLSIS
ncbi:alanine--tRNA ligase [Bacteroidota bacterium]|nr:alanine--tRNA ligase [Bacteroidota bacterium]